MSNHRALWILLVVTVILDFATTLVFMYQDGIEQEKNIVVRWLATNSGIVLGVAIGKLLQLASAVLFSALSIKLSRAILLLFTLLNVMAIIINLR